MNESASDGPRPSAAPHPFEQRPHRELVRLSFPVFVSLMAEPLTGLVDTAFIATLGSSSMAALGAAAVVLSSLFWAFNFLGIGTQTEVSRAFGSDRLQSAKEVLGAALTLSIVLGVLLAGVMLPLFGAIADLMGTVGETREGAISYLRIRILGAPAVLLTMAVMGGLRGVQDMRTPLRIAILTNAINLVLDPLLIFGLGPVPAMGLTGAAIASTVSQWIGAAAAIVAVRARLGWERPFDVIAMRRLLVVGRDLFLRTGSLMLFLLLATRSATRLGDDSGAAHQAIRQVWFMTALILDAFAAAAQSLLGYFAGAGRIDVARRVAAVSCVWGIATGVVLALAMLVGEAAIIALLVPSTAVSVFGAAWIATAVAQPLNAISFVTDGIHWATKDYRFLRNVMLLATGVFASVLVWMDETGRASLLAIWILTGGWITVRAVFGLLRVWPGIGRAPLGSSTRPSSHHV